MKLHSILTGAGAFALAFAQNGAVQPDAVSPETECRKSDWFHYETEYICPEDDNFERLKDLKLYIPIPRPHFKRRPGSKPDSTEEWCKSVMGLYRKLPEMLCLDAFEPCPKPTSFQDIKALECVGKRYKGEIERATSDWYKNESGIGERVLRDAKTTELV